MISNVCTYKKHKILECEVRKFQLTEKRMIFLSSSSEYVHLSCVIEMVWWNKNSQQRMTAVEMRACCVPITSKWILIWPLKIALQFLFILLPLFYLSIFKQHKLSDWWRWGWDEMMRRRRWLRRMGWRLRLQCSQRRGCCEYKYNISIMCLAFVLFI